MFKKCRICEGTCEKIWIGQWSFIGPGSEKKWYSSENSPQGAWDHIADEMLLEFAESGHPTFRATTPLSRVLSKAKGEENCLYTSLQMKTQLIQFIALFFLSISSVSTEQCQLYAKNLRAIKIDRGEPEIMMDQSIVLGEVKAEAPLRNENPMNDQILWQQYIQQVESLSPENKVSKFCKEAGFMRVVEVGQIL